MPFGAQQRSPADAKLASMLEEHQLAATTVCVISKEGAPDLWRALDDWAVSNELSDVEMVAAGIPLLQTREAFAVVEGAADVQHQQGGKRMGRWCAEQADRGRGVFVRGNPFDPEGGLLGAYATEYLDVALSVRRPGCLLQPPAGGWKDSSQIAETGAVELAVKNYPFAVVALVGAVAVGSIALGYVLVSR